VVNERNAAAKPNHFNRIALTNKANTITSDFNFEENMILDFTFSITNPSNTLQIGIGLNDKYQSRVFTILKPVSFFKNDGTNFHGRLMLPAGLIAPNDYSFAFAIWEKNGRVHDYIDNICSCRIHDTGTDLALYEGSDNGSIIIQPSWLEQ
jgi:lipopolysaccharide transport system ATP-binding protein